MTMGSFRDNLSPVHDRGLPSQKLLDLASSLELRLTRKPRARTGMVLASRRLTPPLFSLHRASPFVVVLGVVVQDPRHPQLSLPLEIFFSSSCFPLSEHSR
jgi:hypothetical protein